MEIKIKPLSTWSNVVFDLYIGNNYSGSFDSFKEAQNYGLKLTNSFLLLENNWNNMLDNKIQKFIQDNGLVRIQASPMSEAFDLWECPGGHVWTFDMIIDSAKK